MASAAGWLCGSRPEAFLLDTDDAVTRIAEAVLREESTYTFPLPMAVAMTALRQLPDAAYDALSTKLR